MRNLCLIGMLIIHACIFPAMASTRAPQIQTTFEVEGSKVSCVHFSIVLTSGSRSIRPKIEGTAFAIPQELEGFEQVDLSVKCDGYRLFFPGVYTSKFKPGSWTFGIQHPPFTEELVAGTANMERAKFTTYIKFLPTEFEGTELVIVHWKQDRN